MTRLKLRFEALASEIHKVENAMRMLVGALGDDCPNPGPIKMGEFSWFLDTGGVVRVVIPKQGDAYVVGWALDHRHARNSEVYEDSVVAAKKIRSLLKKAGLT